MKNVKVMLSAALVAAALTSCKDGADKTAEKTVDNFLSYVDSINKLDVAARTANWDAIREGYETRYSDAQTALKTLGNDDKAEEKITKSESTFSGVKQQAEEAAVKAHDEATAAAANPLADSLFGAGTIVGSDMTFNWVNKDNILKVYQNFYETFKANKDSYSRQDLDKIKAWYEALDSRKNTVEKEGLTSEDNNKIAGLKLKFAPMFKWERITAKGEENKEAKAKAN